MHAGLLVAFEGLDQSGKQTQAELLRDRLEALGRQVALLQFPDYTTPLGTEIGLALRGERSYAADLLQLLYVANRYEWRGEIERLRASGAVVVCDRYVASSVAYGEAQGLDPSWLTDIQRHLPAPDLTLLLDMAPEVSAGRKATGRDRFEQDLALLARVRTSYQRQVGPGWVRLDANRDRDAVAADVWQALASRL
ncbi:MAG: dTMP kinase [Acidobacteria bacterium]|nr:dTMP kinase [Acidobacteriota bacterium]